MRSLFLALTLSASAVAMADERPRYVLAVGSHDGGEDRDRLRHAFDDARDLVDTLTSLGGVSADHVVLLADPTVTELRMALDGLTDRLAKARAAGQVPEVVFYYSGHSDERGLTPFGMVLPWNDLRASLAAMPAEVRIAVVDSCASGSMVRGKGGVHAEGFLQDRTSLVSGSAVITSASADESAQESDRLGSSFFTYHLVAGLRGAADADSDLRVTLGEAYTYAYDQTVKGTELSWAGAQHPNYDIDLAGRGDVVLTDLRSRDARVSFDERLDGVISVRDAEGRLVAELSKTMGTPVTYALPEGRYTLRLWARDTTFKARITVGRDAPLVVGVDQFERVTNLEPTRIRGPREPTWKLTHPVSFQLAPFVGTYGTRRDIRLVGLGINVLGSLQPEVRGWSFGTLQVDTGDLDGVDWQGIGSYVHGRVRGWQLGGFASSGRLLGAQTAVVNHVGGDADGLQLGGVNWVEGTQRGVQLGGLFNFVRGTSVTGQTGLQIASLFNHAASGQTGVQLAAVNSSARLVGAQLGGVNVTGTMRGFQLGAVNVARHLDGEALGVLNIIQNGYHAIELGTDAYSPIALQIKAGSRHLYSVFRFGLDPGYEPLGTTVGWGLGGHVTYKRFSFDGDVSAMLPERPARETFGAVPEGLDFLITLSPAVELSKTLAIYGGPTLGIGYRFDGGDSDPGTTQGLFVPSWTAGTGPGTMVRMWVGYHGGLRVRF